MDAEQADWARLRALEHLDRLDRADALQMNFTVQDARYRNWRLALVTDQLFDMAKALAVHPLPNTTPSDRSTCLPITTTRARRRAERLADRRTIGFAAARKVPCRGQHDTAFES
jgi:hypothetical protein